MICIPVFASLSFLFPSQTLQVLLVSCICPQQLCIFTSLASLWDFLWFTFGILIETRDLRLRGDRYWWKKSQHMVCVGAPVLLCPLPAAHMLLPAFSQCMGADLWTTREKQMRLHRNTFLAAHRYSCYGNSLSPSQCRNPVMTLTVMSL